MGQEFGQTAGSLVVNAISQIVPGITDPNLVLPTTGDISTWVRDALLSERFAQLFAEGFRMQDLYRFNLVTAKLGAGRLVKLPLSVTEAINNPNIRIGGGKCPGIS